MFLRISSLHNEDRLQGTLNNLARGPVPAKVRFYDDSGTPQVPASTSSAAVGVLLCEVTLKEPLGTISGGVLTWDLPDDALVLATGTVKYARFIDGNGAASIDCSVTNTSGDGPIKVLDTNLLAGGSLRVVSAVFG